MDLQPVTPGHRTGLPQVNQMNIRLLQHIRQVISCFAVTCLLAATNGHAGHMPKNVVKDDVPVPVAKAQPARAAAQEHREATPIFLRRA